MTPLPWCLGLLILLLFPGNGRAQGYNEVYDPAGHVRSHYLAVLEQTAVDLLRPPPYVVEDMMSQSPLGDKIKILPIPLILPESEYKDILVQATRQIGRALVRFFEDLAIGPGLAFRQGGFIPRSVVNLILRDEQWTLRSLRALWKGKKPEDILFRFGPDFVRAPDGSFVPLEINVGNVGGIGDLTAARTALENSYMRTLVYQHHLKGEDEYELLILSLLNFFSLQTQDVLAFAGPFLLPEDLDLNFILNQFQNMFSELPRQEAKDLESSRKYDLLDRIGRGDIMSLGIDKKTLTVTSPWKPSLILNEHTLDYQKYQITKVYLDELFKKRSVKFMNAPGTEILANKAWLIYLPQMIRFYLHETPIVFPAPTRLLDGRGRRLKNENRVVKKANSQGGENVHIVQFGDTSQLPFINKLANRAAITGCLNALYVDQDFVEHSFLQTPWMRYKVDFRPIAQVMSPDHVYVSRVPFCRSAERNKTNNVSNGAQEVVVLFESASCASMF